MIKMKKELMSEGDTYEAAWLEKGWDARDSVDNKDLELYKNFLKKQIERNKKLNKALKLAVNTLKEVAKDFGTDYCDGNCLTARETLDKINEIVGEK